MHSSNSTAPRSASALAISPRGSSRAAWSNTLIGLGALGCAVALLGCSHVDEPQTVVVHVVISGQGTVTALNDHVSATVQGDTITFTEELATSVGTFTLEASPTSGFLGWGGDCASFGSDSIAILQIAAHPAGTVTTYNCTAAFTGGGSAGGSGGGSAGGSGGGSAGGSGGGSAGGSGGGSAGGSGGGSAGGSGGGSAGGSGGGSAGGSGGGSAGGSGGGSGNCVNGTLLPDGGCDHVPLTNRSSNTSKTFYGVGGWTAGTPAREPDDGDRSDPGGERDGNESAGSIQYLAVGASGALDTSPDGITWTLGSFGASLAGEDFQAAAIGSTAAHPYVVIGTDSYGLGGFAVYSADGATWTRATGAGAPSAAFDVVWNGAQFLTAGQGGEFCTSPDGATWTAHSGGASFSGVYPARVVWTGSQYVMAGSTSSGPAIGTSPDGISWTLQPGISSATSQGLVGLAYGGGMLVATGAGAANTSGDLVVSSDGVTWAYRAGAASALATFEGQPASKVLPGVGWTGTYWVAMGGGVGIYSADSAVWAPLTLVNTANVYALTAVGPRALVAVGANGSIVTSE